MYCERSTSNFLSLSGKFDNGLACKSRSSILGQYYLLLKITYLTSFLGSIH